MDNKYGTALTVAASCRLIDNSGSEIQIGNLVLRSWAMAIVSLLLDRGADINAVGGEYGTPLAAAAFGGNKDIVSLLLDRGADISLVGGNYGTVLVAAIFSRSMDVVSLLLNRGADINMVSSEYGTALAAAAFCESVDVVSLLLDRGADINAMGGKYGTPLAAAASSGNMDIVSLLLDQGADISLVGSKYGTALAVASLSGNTDIVSLLMEHGADVRRVGGSYSTALGVYPSALDVAYSQGSKADAPLLALLKTAIEQRNGPKPQPTYPTVNDVISRTPFPMPYTVPDSALCAGHHMDILSSFNILSTEFHVGDSITSEQADVQCWGLNEEGLWRSLVALIGLNEDAIQTKLQWIRNDVRYFISCNFDFGLAYAAARVAWKNFNEHSMDCNTISIQRGQWHKHAQLLDEVRSKAIEIQNPSPGQAPQELIIFPYSIMPRRLWDLKSNRVVNFQMLHAAQSTIETAPQFWAVSHSWTSNMSPVWTAINQNQWPVLLPKGISLDYLRAELLNFGAEYIWVDVVCLRQQSEVNYLEQLRREEWKLDFPTIGNIYCAAAHIIRYFNGLGVHFSSNGWDDKRHWLQRAWTLQEIAAEKITINGGTPRNRGRVLLNSRGKAFGKDIRLRDVIRPVLQLAAQIDSPQGCEVYELAREMTRRHASRPLDKISGLFYLLRTTKLPCYDAHMTSEDFWKQCFHLLPVERKAEILFDFPYRGSDKQWFPTWAQVLDWPERDPAYDHMRFQSLPDLMKSFSEQMSFFISSIWTVPDAILHETDCPEEYEVEINKRRFGFYLPYLSQKPINIQRQLFTLAITDLGHAHNWVVCEAIEKRGGTNVGLSGIVKVNVLRKVGVFRTDDCSKLLVGGESGASLLQKMDCLFV